MSKKKIELTDAMVEAGASSAWEEVNPGILGWNSISERHKEGCRRDARAVLTAGLNHPDAAGLFAGEDTIRAAREQGWDQAVDWIRGEQEGPSWHTTNARLANPYRPAPALPTEDGAVIIPADGHEYIEAVIDGQTYYAREAMRINGLWRAVWRTPHCFQVRYSVLPWKVTPGTWKMDGEDSAR